METASENQCSSQSNDLSTAVNLSNSSIIGVKVADENGGGDADKSPRREKEAVRHEEMGQGDPNKAGEEKEAETPCVVDGTLPRTPSSLYLGPVRRSPDFQLELMASGPGRHLLNTPQGPVEPQTNLIVNYLPQTLSDDDFRMMFTNIGPIYSCRIMRDKRTGYSFGYGFVNYVKTQDALKAIQTLNGKQIQNKNVKVALARPSGEDIKHANLYVKGLPKEMKRDTLAELFRPYGDIIQSKILVDQYTGYSKGAGFILYSKRSEADQAIQALHNAKPPGFHDYISVKRAKDESGEKSMVHHVIHHYQYPPGPHAHMGSPDMGSLLSGYYPQGPHPPTASQMQPGLNPVGSMSAARGSNFFPSSFTGSVTNNPPRTSPQAVKLGPQMPYQFVPSSYPAQITPVNNNMSDAGYLGNHFSSMSLGSHGSSNSDHMSGGKGGDNGFSEVLFVYNIGANADEKTLWSLFQPYGDITKVNVIRDHSKGGVSKGFGFVTMATPDQAHLAMEHLNGYILNGRPIQVSPKK